MVRMAGTYGTAGNLGKNVTLVCRANNLVYTDSASVIAGGGYLTPWIPVDGYGCAKVTICLYSNANGNFYQLRTRHSGGIAFYVETRHDFTGYIVQTYDVPNEEIQISFINNEASSRFLSIDVYLVP